MVDKAKKDLVVRGSSPAELIKLAVEGNADLDKLEKLLSIQERWQKGEAKKAFVKAMTAFKAESPTVTKDKLNSQYNSKYTSLSNLVNTVNPILSKHGLTASWDIKQNGTIEVSCKITHELGHSEIALAAAPADKSGAKNEIQQIKSTITYLKAVTFESICGLASTDANLDDDGNGATSELISEAEVNKILDAALEAKVEMVRILKYMKVENLEAIAKTDYKKIMIAIDKAKKKVVPNADN